MRKKIYLGFFSLMLLLLFAGAISVYELKRLGAKANELIELDVNHTEAAEGMLFSLQEENRAVIKMIISVNSTPGEDYEKARLDFETYLSKIAETDPNDEIVTKIRIANEKYLQIVGEYANEALYSDMIWFTNTYLDVYYALYNTVKEYISTPKKALSERTSLLESNIYKTISPSILTLFVAILIVLMLLYFVGTYYIKPLRNINKGLKGYIERKIPFDDSFKATDDLESLKNMITELIEQSKKH